MQKKLAILISGGGTTAEATIRAIQNNQLANLTPSVISSNSHAKGNERVRKLGIEPIILDKDSFRTREEFDNKLFQVIEELQPDVISLQGWLLLIPKSVVQKYEGRIVNQHPGPLDPGRPDFGGKGMSTPYRTNCARIAYIWATQEEPWTESDTHFVTEQFDMGRIIRTEKMPIPAKSKKISIEALQNDPQELIQTTHDVQKVFYPVEHQNVIKTLLLLSNGIVKEYKRPTPLISDKHVDVLSKAKKLAIELFPSYNL